LFRALGQVSRYLHFGDGCVVGTEAAFITPVDDVRDSAEKLDALAN
jgi:hypothetical protein